MAIWNPGSPAKSTSTAVAATDVAVSREAEPNMEYATSTVRPLAIPEPRMKESIISADLNIEGKIEGSGDIRIAGRFKGDVNVQGNLTIEAGATLTGAVRAKTVAIGGHLEGNVDAAARVDLLATGVLIGDLTADSLTVAAGSRMRGKAEFGWPETGSRTP
ncbi:MAG: polymer-forming cytoskeletal protein [Gemmatimonadaceae bacterium]|nr:polymer-forming cytoskeletal protein [Gemmatimonadaceae bacterium]